MCPGPFPLGPGVRRVPRNVIRMRRVHAFAANRYAEATTARSVRFWHGVMNACVRVEWDIEPAPEYWELIRRIYRA
jgi:hypothetical protein